MLGVVSRVPGEGAAFWFDGSDGTAGEMLSESEFDGPRRQGSLSAMARRQSGNTSRDEEVAAPALVGANTNNSTSSSGCAWVMHG